MLVVSKCMLCPFRPSFEVVKEGRILHLVSGYRRFYSSLRIDASNHITAKRHQFDSG